MVRWPSSTLGIVAAPRLVDDLDRLIMKSFKTLKLQDSLQEGKRELLLYIYKPTFFVIYIYIYIKST
jgi:hypothetical protein